MISNGGIEACKLTPSSVPVFFEDLKRAVGFLEDPFDYGGIMHRLIYLRAGQMGYKNIIDGVDGDIVASLSSGYPAYLFRDGLLGKTNFTEWPHRSLACFSGRC